MRNAEIGSAVDLIISRLDEFCDGAHICAMPEKTTRASIDSVIKKQKGSVRLASVFLLSYSLLANNWNYKDVPVGIRGKYGDKRLAAALTERHANFHFSITAFGENLGWKGNVRNVSLDRDPRFSEFIASIKPMDKQTRRKLFDYAVYKIYESRSVPKPLPPLPPEWLSYARSLLLCEGLLNISSEGHIQQFLVAGFLSVHRARFGHTISTHHPHASDKFDGTSGDIEEFRDGLLVGSYEVTVRDDWKNRMPDFQKKATNANLSKYVIIASNVRTDPNLSSASTLLDFLGNSPLDIAIVDIYEFFAVFCAELSANEIRNAINATHEFLMNPKFCGRSVYIDAFADHAREWINAR